MEARPSRLLIPNKSFHPTGNASPNAAASTIFLFFLLLPHCPPNSLIKPSNASSLSIPTVLLRNSSPNGSSAFANFSRSTTTPFLFTISNFR